MLSVSVFTCMCGVFLEALFYQTIVIFSQILIDCGVLNCFRRLWNRGPSKKQYKRLLPDIRFWQPLDENVIISEAEN